MALWLKVKMYPFYTKEDIEKIRSLPVSLWKWLLNERSTGVSIKILKLSWTNIKNIGLDNIKIIRSLPNLIINMIRSPADFSCVQALSIENLAMIKNITYSTIKTIRKFSSESLKLILNTKNIDDIDYICENKVSKFLILYDLNLTSAIASLTKDEILFYKKTPDEILAKIISYFDKEDYLKLKCVCEIRGGLSNYLLSHYGDNEYLTNEIVDNKNVDLLRWSLINNKNIKVERFYNTIRQIIIFNRELAIKFIITILNIRCDRKVYKTLLLIIMNKKDDLCFDIINTYGSKHRSVTIKTLGTQMDDETIFGRKVLQYILDTEYYDHIKNYNYKNNKILDYRLQLRVRYILCSKGKKCPDQACKSYHPGEQILQN